MKTAFRLIIVLLLVLGWSLAALSLHVIRTPDDIPITLVTKERFGLTDTYVDTRHWTLEDITQHQALVDKLIKLDKAELLKHLVKDQRGGDVKVQLIGALQRAPRKDDGPTSTQPTSASARGGLFGLF